MPDTLWNLRMIRKASQTGVGCSVVELGGVRHFFVAAAARQGAGFRQQAQDVLRGIEGLLKAEGARASIVMQSVFLGNSADEAECRAIMREFYGADMPATTYIWQPPCDGALLAIEAMGVGRTQGQGELEIVRRGEDTVIVRHSGIAWAHVGGVRGETAAVHGAATSAFELAAARLESAGFRFEEVIRTWLYLGDITGMEGQQTRYAELNRARADVYRDLKFAAGSKWSEGDSPVFGDHRRPLLRSGARSVPAKTGTVPVFPASTGIGADGKHVTIGCMAMRAERAGVRAVAIENPKQTAAYDYAHQYGNESPKFCRAMAVAADDFAAIFISGTASITASETRHLGDIGAQTAQTLDNIESLIAEANLADHGLAGCGSTLADLALVRVYIKRREDYALARAICEKRLGGVPVIYALGDICRAELLVEIEGIAFSQQKQ